MYLLDEFFFGRLRDPAGMGIQFVFLPFPSPSRVPTGANPVTTPEELHRPIAQRVTDWIKNLRNDPRFDTGLRTVLVAHLSVTDTEYSRGRFALTDRHEILADAADLPQTWDYVVLGHNHKPQCIRGVPHVRYAGSLDRLDFSERDEEKGVVLVDIGMGGRKGEPRFIAIEPTSLVEVRVPDAHVTVEQLQAQVPDPATALVKVIVEPAATADASARSIEPSVRRCPSSLEFPGSRQLSIAPRRPAASN